MFVYLSGPLTATADHSAEEHATVAATIYFSLIRAGIDCFCPHLVVGRADAFLIPYERWMAYDFAMIDRATHMLMLPRWVASPGTVREHDYATRRGLTICEDLADLLSKMAEK